METINLFVISGIAIFAMIGVRMLEIKYERCIGLAYVSMKVDKRLKPHAKRLSKAIDAKKETFAYKMGQVPVRIKVYAAARAENARAKLAAHYEFMAHSFRGKKMLSGGSVSFFLLNISDYGRKSPEHMEAVRKLEQPLIISLSDLETEEEVVEKA